MSSKSDTAEIRFREAFERLKGIRTQLLPSGTAVTQNNVAKEAGRDPTALRKSRYPALVREIQAWVEIMAQTEAVQRKRQSQRRKAADAKTAVADLKKQRDHAQSQLVSAHQAILELSQENALLRVRLDELRPPPKPFGR